MKRRVQFALSFILMMFVIPLIHPLEAFSSSFRDEMIAKAKKEGQVVLTGSTADRSRTQLVGFKKLYPFITVKAFVASIPDSVNRITAEANAGRLSTDVVALSSDGLELLAKLGLLEKMKYPHMKDFYPGMQPSHGAYVQAFLSPRVQGVYNSDLVPPDEVPKSWEEMTDPKWKGKTMISRTSEEFPALLAYIWAKDGKLDWERSFDFFTKLMKQEILIARGFRGGIKRLAAGEVSIFWFGATGPPARLHFQGAPVGLIAFPKFPGVFSSFGIVKGALHPAAAWLFIDYITSTGGQHEYTESVSAQQPVNKKAKPGKLANWVFEQGGTVENTVPVSAEVVFSEDVHKKSETFFYKLIGIK